VNMCKVYLYNKYHSADRIRRRGCLRMTCCSATCNVRTLRHSSFTFAASVFSQVGSSYLAHHLQRSCFIQRQRHANLAIVRGWWVVRPRIDMTATGEALGVGSGSRLKHPYHTTEANILFFTSIGTLFGVESRVWFSRKERLSERVSMSSTSGDS
jgi:hypothetical protein